jgi:ATP-dependent Clp protease protease subunit
MTDKPFDQSEWASTYFERGIDTKLRRIFLGEIDETSAMNVVKGLYFLNTIDPDGPIELFIKSPGGDVYQCFAIYDVVGTIAAPVHTFAFGMCMSAAPLLLARGEPGQRWVAEHTAFMTHAYSEDLSGKAPDLKAGLRQGLGMDARWNELLAEHSTKAVRFWKSKASKTSDFYFSAEQAIEWGVADSIWSEQD